MQVSTTLNPEPTPTLRVGCNTTDWTQEQINDTHYADAAGLSLHYHGSASLAPFDGWAADFTYRCQVGLGFRV